VYRSRHPEIGRIKFSFNHPGFCISDFGMAHMLKYSRTLLYGVHIGLLGGVVRVVTGE
jgi:hypothetical protein